MGSLAIQSPPSALPADMAPGSVAGGVSRRTNLPELAEATYLKEVFDITYTLSEAQMEEELVARAVKLGISIPAPPMTAGDDPARPSRGLADTELTDQDGRPASAGIAPGTARAIMAFTAPGGGGLPALGAATASATNADGTPASPGSVEFNVGPGSALPPTATPYIDPLGGPITRKRSRNLSFSHYDKYLAQLNPNLKQPKFLKETAAKSSAPRSLFSVKTRKSLVSLTRSIGAKVRWKRSSVMGPPQIQVSCICCREEFTDPQVTHTLPCGHTYCSGCAKIMVNQSSTDESKMPPRCCTQPIPSSIIKSVLPHDDQQTFLKAVLQFSTPWESRIFCPNTSCGEFIRPRSKIDPKHPFDVSCRKCRTRACVMCKRAAHPIGQDCPADWELDAVLKMGERSGWRRCYKCRTLVELSQGCTHMTCRCKAQFCYICGAVWDTAVGCPNYCNGELELERRQMAEAARMAALERQAEAEEQGRQEALARTAESAEFEALRVELEGEKARFLAFEQKTKWLIWTRHMQERMCLVDRYADQIVKMEDRHAKTILHLEDRQIAAEWDLRSTLSQREKSVKIRLRHMEAYCHGLGRNQGGGNVGGVPATAGEKGKTNSETNGEADGENNGNTNGETNGKINGRASSSSGPPERPLGSVSGNSGMPPRVVTERDLRELGQQYNTKADLKRLHQSHINVLRDKQAKNMEELQQRQQDEMQRLCARRNTELEDLEVNFALEDDVLVQVFVERRRKIQTRWETLIRILQKEMELKTKAKYGPIPVPVWPSDSGEGEGDSEAAVAPATDPPATASPAMPSPTAETPVAAGADAGASAVHDYHEG